MTLVMVFHGVFLNHFSDSVLLDVESRLAAQFSALEHSQL